MSNYERVSQRVPDFVPFVGYSTCPGVVSMVAVRIAYCAIAQKEVAEDEDLSGAASLLLHRGHGCLLSSTNAYVSRTAEPTLEGYLETAYSELPESYRKLASVWKERIEKSEIGGAVPRYTRPASK